MNIFIDPSVRICIIENGPRAFSQKPDDTSWNDDEESKEIIMNTGSTHHDDECHDQEAVSIHPADLGFRKHMCGCLP